MNVQTVGITSGIPTSGTGTVSTLDGLITWLGANSLTVTGTFYQATQPISASALPLPTGAASLTEQQTINTSLGTINTTLGTPMQASGGSVTANAGTNLNTSTLATSTNITGGGQKTQIVDGSGNIIASSGNALNVNVVASSATQAVSGSVKLLDTGGSTVATVKAASTAPVSTDTSVVTALNPNSPGIIALGPAVPASSVPVVNAGFTYGHMSTSTTTTFKSGAGVLHAVIVNTLGTVASNATIYDNTAGSGTVIAVLNTLTTGEGTYTYDVAFTTGLTLVTTGTVAPDITVSYR